MKNKVVIITGSSQGIGKATAWELAQKGAKVVLNGRNEDKLNATFQSFVKAGLAVTAICGDVALPADCAKIINHVLIKYGQIDYLINNAAVSVALAPFEQIQPTVFRKVFEVNVLGAFNMTHAALPAIKNSKGGILFISSLASIFGLPEAAAYASSKMALTALSESLKLELTESGVYVGIAYLSFVKNDLQKTVFNHNGQLIAQPKHRFSNAIHPTIIANQLIQMLEKRRFKQYFSLLGKVFYFLSRLSPWLLKKILLMIYRKRKRREIINESNLQKTT